MCRGYMTVVGHYAVLNVSAGVTTMAQEATSSAEKRFLGRMAYGLETVKAVLDFSPTRFLLDVDGKEEAQEAMDLTVRYLKAIPVPTGEGQPPRLRRLTVTRAPLFVSSWPLPPGDHRPPDKDSGHKSARH